MGGTICCSAWATHAVFLRRGRNGTPRLRPCPPQFWDFFLARNLDLCTQGFPHRSFCPKSMDGSQDVTSMNFLGFWDALKTFGTDQPSVPLKPVLCGVLKIVISLWGCLWRVWQNLQPFSVAFEPRHSDANPGRMFCAGKCVQWFTRMLAPGGWAAAWHAVELGGKCWEPATSWMGGHQLDGWVEVFLCVFYFVNLFVCLLEYLHSI